MKVERLGPPTEFAARVAAHLAQFAQPALPLPSAAQLTSLIETAFYASMYEEEARRTEFNIAWQLDGHSCAELLAIQPPLRVTPKTLAKLAPATRREASSIAVRPEGGELVAWALLEQAATTTEPLTVRVLASGVLRVDYDGAPRALYARGETYLSGGPHDVASPAQVLTRTFGAWSDGAEPGTGVDLRAAVVARIASRALEHRHGGMILVMPADAAAPIGVRIHYGVGAGADVLARRYADVIRDVPPADRLERLRGSRARSPGGRVSVRDESQIAFAEAIDLVARLTAIDNAVLLDTELRVLGFGAQVLEGDAPDLDFEHADPYSDDVHVDDLATFKGTRHPAGVIFCMRQPSEAAAIIASQDGRLSLAVRNERRTVQVFGSYESAFGWT